MPRIEKLSPEQIARFPEFVNRWTNIGLCTDPANRPEAERAIRLMYESAGQKPPAKIVWCGSPLSQGITRAIILDNKLMNGFGASVRESVWESVRDSVRDSVGASVRASVGASVRESVGASVGASVRASVWESVRDSVWESVWESVRASVWESVRASVWESVSESVGDSVRESVRASVWESVRASVWESVWASVRASVWESVRASVWESVSESVWASVRASVRESVWESVRDSVRDSVYGQHDASWLAFYRYFNDVCSLESQTQKLGGLWLLAQNAGWALPHKNICWVSERHNILRRDERGLLHDVAGPAVTFPDGWAIYAWHGTRIPAEWITGRKSLTAKTAITWRNIEQRRAAIEILGWNAILDELNARTIDADHDPQIGTLVEVDLPDLSRPSRFLRVTCGTGREFAIGVPAEIDTAIAAQAWTQNLPPTEFTRPEIRS